MVKKSADRQHLGTLAHLHDLVIKMRGSATLTCRHPGRCVRELVTISHHWSPSQYYAIKFEATAWPLRGSARPERFQRRNRLPGSRRFRKLKCDETRPICRQCRSKSLRCEGYGARLQWLPPETGRSLGRIGRTSSSTGLQQRCQINPEILEEALSEHEIEALLGDLDLYNLTHNPRKNSYTKTRGLFGVFAASSEHEREYASGTLRTPPELYASQDYDDDLITSSTPAAEPTIQAQYALEEASPSPTRDIQRQSPSVVYSPPPQISIASPIDSLITGHEVIDVDSTTPTITSPAIEHREQNQTVHSTIDDFNFQTPHSSHGSSRNVWLYDESPEWTITSLPKSPSTPQSLSSQERYLMHHYMNRVVDLFSVISNQKSPWKTLHLPRALQAVGELDINGHTSKIRLALLRTLLSISAFFLSNDHKAHGRNEKADFWRDAASTLRSQAIQLLKSAIDTDFYSPAGSRYKEFLATMLSMITIDVISGDTATCAVHLAGCRQLIQHTAKRKSHFSAKARALHRIYFFLCTIYSSTRVWEQHHFNSITSTSTVDGSTPENHETDFPQDESQWLDLGDGLPRDLSATEFIYGVPLSLLILMRKTTDLIQSLPPCRPYIPGFERRSDQQYSSQRCDEVEREILDWSSDAELAQFASAADTETYQIIKQYTLGFHNALIIYFSQHIRLMSYRYLRPYVEIVLDCMEVVENIKTSSEIFAGPIFWPMFIAASEAFDESLQQRCKAWFARMDVYSVGAARIGNEIIEEVWRRQAHTTQLFSTSLWRVVVEDQRKTLVLS